VGWLGILHPSAARGGAEEGVDPGSAALCVFRHALRLTAVPRQRRRVRRVGHTTRQAAAALRLQPRQIRNLIGHGELEAQTEGEGVNRRYLVSIASVDALRQKRQEEGKLPGKDRDVAEGAVMPGQPGQAVPVLARELATGLGEAGYRLGKAEARLELTAEAESTIR
jgi:hypothetical protein